MWVDPDPWLDDDIVTAGEFVQQARDNMRFLYSPPMCRAAGSGNQETTVGVLQMLDFPVTVRDNDGMHGGSQGVQNEPASGLIEVQTAGKYLTRFAVDLDWTTTGTSEAGIGIRAAPTNAWFLLARDISGIQNSGGPHTAMIAEQAYPCLAGYQFAGLVYGALAGTTKAIAGYNMPLLYAHWLGGP